MDSREERLQQRLRGAQRRAVKEVEFDLVFPVAAPAPAPVSPNLPSATPNVLAQSEVPPSDHPVQAQLPSQTPARPQAVQEQPPASTVHSVNDANTSAKRRKLDTDQTTSSIRSTRSSQNVPRVDIYELVPDEEEQDTSVVDLARSLLDQVSIPETSPEPSIIPPAATPRPSSSLQLPTQALEITESPADAPGSGHRRRLSFNDPSNATAILHEILDSSFAESEPPSSILQRKRKRRPIPSSHSPESQPIGSAQTRNAVNTHNELPAEQPTKRTRISRKATKDAPKVAEPVVSNEPEESEEAEAINDEEAATQLKKNRGRRKSRNTPAESSVLEENEKPDSPVARRRKRPRVDASPVQQRHPKNVSQKPKAPSKAAKRSSVSKGPPIPVTVYRLVGEVVYDDDLEDADILNTEIPRAKRAGVNGIDVLHDLCQEILGSTLATLEETGSACEDSAQRLECKAKWNAIEAYRYELQTRLTEHTINLDNSYSLSRRLKDAQRRKLELREEILRIRAEREQVALRTDEVLTKHDNDKTKAQDRNGLNNAVHDIELAIDLGKTSQLDDTINPTEQLTGIELLLKRVAGEVSNKGDSGGILKQIKEFNAFLERASVALESRKT